MNPFPRRPFVFLVLFLVLLACDSLTDPPTEPQDVLTPASVHLAAATGETAERVVMIENLSDAPIHPQVVSKPVWLHLDYLVSSIAPYDWEDALRLSMECRNERASDVGVVRLDLGADLGTVELEVSRTCPSPLNDPNDSAYDIDLVFVDAVPPPPAHQQAFERAAQRWSEVITGDLGDIEPSTDPEFPLLPEGYCGRTTNAAGINPAWNDGTDDLVIFVSVREIDGIGRILGMAGPCEYRFDETAADHLLPWAGTMKFDEADLDALAADGLLESTIMHEMGHVLGIGSLWELQWISETYDPIQDLLSPTDVECVENDPNDVRFVGQWATAQHNQLNAARGHPRVEHDFALLGEGYSGQGSDCSHWDENTYGTELMTGLLTVDRNGHTPLSRMTVGSLDDLGYQVDYAAADDYTPPSGLRLQSQRGQDGFAISEREIILTPPAPKR